MDKKVISFSFNYARETKNFHVYSLAEDHKFFPKAIHISKEDQDKPVKKVTVNIVITEG